MTFDGRQTLILAILTLFLGKFLNRKIAFFRNYNIPEPVTGGVAVSVAFGLIYLFSNTEVNFQLGGRDALLIIFFTTIGLNSQIRTLLAGGKPLLILLVLAVAYLILQNLTGIAIAKISGLPDALGILGGSISLSGGHGTAIAWAPRLTEEFGLRGASEIGIACATFGLILGGVIGGPVSNFLIKRHGLKTTHKDASPIVGLPDAAGDTDRERQAQKITVDSVLSCLLVISLAVGLGVTIGDGLESGFGLALPDFVVCLFAGILMSNLIPPLMKKVAWPSGTASLALISDLSLGLFLAMSLMSLQLWTLADLAGPILILLVAQVAVMMAWSIFVIYRAMGSNYDAAVMAAGFCGLGLGATPTAIANMSAVTRKCGPSPQAFLIVPLVGAFFIDIANAFVIQTLLNWTQ